MDGYTYAVGSQEERCFITLNYVEDFSKKKIYPTRPQIENNEFGEVTKSIELISEVLIWILMCAHDQGETCMTCVWLDFSLPYFEGIDALCAVPPGSLYSISTFK